MDKRQLAGTCIRLRSHIRSLDLASPEEVSEVWPKPCGCNDPRPCSKCFRAKKDDWWETRCQLMRFMGRDDWHASRQEVAEEEVLKAVRDEPKSILLLSGDTIEVYPKSLDGLLWFRLHDYVVEWLNSRREYIEYAHMHDEGDYPEEVISTLARIDDEIVQQLSLMAYAASQEQVNVDRDKLDGFDLPPPYDTLDIIDLLRIMQAFWEVNVARLNLLPYLTGPQKPGSSKKRMSWNVFAGTLAMKLNTDMKTVMRDYSLAALLAQVKLAQPDIADELDA